ncbi:MAG: hypothetical protein SPI94_06875 [Candidatus Onthovivens sp.]|nr:hypothetical protein [Candidatus Onthovivens sp.]
MNFYQLIKQQYEYYNSKRAFSSCSQCPCKVLRNTMLDSNSERRGCRAEIVYLAYKYNIRNNAHSCKDCMDISLKIAKKIIGTNRI